MWERCVADLYLASRSPRRAELLGQIGVGFTLLESDVDEQRLAEEMPLDYVKRLALDKANAGYAALREEQSAENAIVLGADTVVYTEQALMGKPTSAVAAAEYLRTLSGRAHSVATAVSLVFNQNGQRCAKSTVSISQVRFKPLSDAEIAAYCATREPYDKAGAYAVQGYAAMFIESISGSYSGIMGLPLFEIAQLFSELGIATAIGH